MVGLTFQKARINVKRAFSGAMDESSTPQEGGFMGVTRVACVMGSLAALGLDPVEGALSFVALNVGAGRALGFVDPEQDNTPQLQRRRASLGLGMG